eukprot:2794489-Rhodomonas_salina.5
MQHRVRTESLLRAARSERAAADHGDAGFLRMSMCAYLTCSGCKFASRTACSRTAQGSTALWCSICPKHPGAPSVPRQAVQARARARVKLMVSAGAFASSSER